MQSSIDVIAKAGTASRRFGFAILVGSVAVAGHAQPSGAYFDRHNFGAAVTSSCGTQCPDGSLAASAVVLDAKGNVYGTTLEGGAYNGGVLWEITRSGVYKDLHDFGGSTTLSTGKVGTDGIEPFASVRVDKSGNLYGTTVSGGAYGSTGGVVWELTSSGQYRDLHDFGGVAVTAAGKTVADGFTCYSPVTIDAVGNIYGVTYAGGANPAGSGLFSGAGMLWEITQSGKYLDLHDFAGTVTLSDGRSQPDGNGPFGCLALDGNGNLYGTTLHGGPNSFLDRSGNTYTAGMAWEMTNTGSYRDIHDFGGRMLVNGLSQTDSVYPTGASLDPSGNPIGTTEGAGVNIGLGSVWSIVSGKYTVLHLFGGQANTSSGAEVNDGSTPLAEVSFDRSGNVFGTAFEGGANGSGMVWEITRSGEYVDRHDFGGIALLPGGGSVPDGLGPQSAITFDRNGMLYGVTSVGGSNSAGMVWQMNPQVNALVLKDATLVGGKVTVATINLAEPAPQGDAVFLLSSTSGSAKVQQWLRIPAGSSSGEFRIQTSPVQTATSVVVSAVSGQTTVSSTFVIQAPTIAGIQFATPNTVGGNDCVAIVYLNGPAPAGGITANLSANSNVVSLPSTVTFPAGVTVENFLLGSSEVSSVSSVLVTASTASQSTSSTINIVPLTLDRITLSQTSIPGDTATTVTGVVTFNGPTTGIRSTVGLFSSMPTVASLPEFVGVPAGATEAQFTVHVAPVTSTRVVTIRATMGSKIVSLHLTVHPN